MGSHVRVLLLPLALLAGLVAPRAEAQVVQGRLLESTTKRPVALGTVFLTDTLFQVMEETLTDHEGVFTLQAPEPGPYYLVATRLGYAPKIDGVLVLGANGFIQVDFYVSPRAVEIEGITATAERRRMEQRLEMAGFYDRQGGGFGDFITPEELERRPPRDTYDLLRRVPGMRVNDAYGGQGILCNGREPRVFLDGAFVAFPALRGNSGSSIVLESVVSVSDIAGVEVYRRASALPLQYGGMYTSSVGVPGRQTCTILVWTKAQ